jgi:hypothetical protein
MINPKIAVTTISLLALLFMSCSSAVVAQTTAFTYQGRLTDGGTPANGTYDLQFTLYNASSAAIGSPLAREDVTVTNGVFTVQLDFGASVFTNGQASTLEIGVRPGAATGAFTILSPRQPITATPYAIQTLNASQLGGVAANQYLQTNGNGSGLTNLNAGNITTGALNNSRLGLIPTANIADSAVTAPKIAGGQVVKSLNTLKDDVTLAAGSNITLTPSGNTLTIASTSGGVGGSGTTNTIPLWSAGATLSNSGITQSAAGVQLPNGVQLGVGAQGNQVLFGSPNGETGMTIQGASGRADLRFDGTLKLVAGGGGLTPPNTNGLAITTQGLVGIGTTTPQAKLTVNAGGSGGEVRVSAPDGESGMSIVGTNRADVRFDGQTLKLLAGPGTGSMAATNGININGLGNVGIGTTTPAHRLSLIGGPSWTSNLFTGALELGNASAIGWRANAAGNRFGIGQTTGGLTFFATLSNPGTTGSPANYVMVINDNGNITQPINNNGLVKAMLFVAQDGTILRCYNGITGATTGNCGFVVFRDICASTFCYAIDFPFQVNTRFISLTAQTPTNANVGVGFTGIGTNNVVVKTYIVGGSSAGAPADFMLIVY